MLWALFMPLRRESLVAIAAADAYIHMRTHTHIYIYVDINIESGLPWGLGLGVLCFSVIESCYARVQYLRSIAHKGVVSPIYIYIHIPLNTHQPVHVLFILVRSTTTI